MCLPGTKTYEVLPKKVAQRQDDVSKTSLVEMHSLSQTCHCDIFELNVSFALSVKAERAVCTKICRVLGRTGTQHGTFFLKEKDLLT